MDLLGAPSYTRQQTDLDFASGRYGIPQRDILARWDASTVPGADGALVSALVDSSGNNQDVSAAGTARPTLHIENGYRHISFTAAGTYLGRTQWGNGWMQPSGGFIQPITEIAVARFNTTGVTGSNRNITGASGAGTTSLGLALRYNMPVLQLQAGSNGAYGGPALNDHAWHIIAGVFDTVSSNLYIDGYLIDAQITQLHGTQSSQAVLLGASGTAVGGMDGDLREVLFTRTALTPGQVGKATALLAQKWGLS